jgi:hypothetical protein
MYLKIYIVNRFLIEFCKFLLETKQLTGWRRMADPGGLLFSHGAAILLRDEHENPGHFGRNSSVTASGIAGDLAGIAAFVKHRAQN